MYKLHAFRLCRCKGQVLSDYGKKTQQSRSAVLILPAGVYLLANRAVISRDLKM